MNDNLFYVAQKAFIKKDGKVLVLIKRGVNVDFPGGKIQESDANLIDSLGREIKEETGLTVKINKPFHTWTFTLPPTHKNAGKKVFVVGYDCEYVEGDVSISDEHTHYKWVDASDYELVNDQTVWLEALKVYFTMR